MFMLRLWLYIHVYWQRQALTFRDACFFDAGKQVLFESQLKGFMLFASFCLYRKRNRLIMNIPFFFIYIMYIDDITRREKTHMIRQTCKNWMHHKIYVALSIGIFFQCYLKWFSVKTFEIQFMYANSKWMQNEKVNPVSRVYILRNFMHATLF